MSKTPLPEHIAAVVRRETPGELIRWTGRPSAKQALLWSMLIWLFAIPWTAFSLFWEGMVLAPFITGAPQVPGANWGKVGMGVAVLFGLPFVLIGIGMMAAPFFIWRRAKAVVYVITDKRLLTVEAYSGHAKVKTLWPDRIVSIERTERADGSGTLKLLLGQRRDSEGDMVAETEVISAVPDVRRAEQLLTDFRPQPTRLPGG